MTDVSDLIERLEKAKEGSRELSNEVLVAFGYRWRTSDEGGILLPDNCVLVDPGGKQVVTSHCPSPTESVDDALGFVPAICGGDPWFAIERQNGPKGERVWASCAPSSSPAAMGYDASIKNGSWATTAPLALCAAILRARQSEQGGEP